MNRFGEKLNILRKKKGMTMKQMARALGISSHSYISKLEHGEKLPSVDMALKISRFFNVSLDQLLKDDLEIDESDIHICFPTFTQTDS